MASKNYYDILGAKKDATKDELKKLYRQASMKYHPDRQHDKSDAEKRAAEEKFKEVAEAADVLLDDKKRAQYDQFGTVDGNYGEGGGFDPFDVLRSHFGMRDGFEGFFGGMGGFGGRGGRRSVPGSDIRAFVDISFKESVTGCRKSVSVNKETRCPKCDGSGVESGYSEDVCPDCHGRGMVTTMQGNMMFSTTCRRCGGAGRFNNHPCKHCGGTGHVGKHSTMNVDIPMGIDNGQTFVLEGEGNASPDGSGPNGDLGVTVRVSDSELFKRDGGNVYTTKHITPETAMNGGKVDVMCPDGSMRTVTIEKEQNLGKRVCIGGKGVRFDRRIGRPDGNLYVKFEVDFPKMNEKQSEEFKKLMSSFKNDDYGRIKEYESNCRRY